MPHDQQEQVCLMTSRSREEATSTGRRLPAQGGGYLPTMVYTSLPWCIPPYYTLGIPRSYPVYSLVSTAPPLHQREREESLGSKMGGEPG